jgi:hypothetical protein
MTAWSDCKSADLLMCVMFGHSTYNQLCSLSS